MGCHWYIGTLVYELPLVCWYIGIIIYWSYRLQAILATYGIPTQTPKQIEPITLSSPGEVLLEVNKDYDIILTTLYWIGIQPFRRKQEVRVVRTTIKTYRSYWYKQSMFPLFCIKYFIKKCYRFIKFMDI